MSRIYYKEEQRYTQWWVWLLLLSSFAVAVIPLWYGVYVQISTGAPWGNKPITTDKLVVVSVIVTLFMAALIWIFAVQKLETEISSSGVRYRFYPFVNQWKEIPVEAIGSYTIEKYTPVPTYGGWGVRSGGIKTGKAYSISGNLGLTVLLKDGSRVLIGTRRKEALKYAMDKMLNQSPTGFRE